MAGIQDFVVFEDDFIGARTLETTPAGNGPWGITETAAAGTPTYTVGGINGEATLKLASTSEAENICLDFQNVLSFDVDLIDSIEMRIKTTEVLKASNTLTFGLSSARNDTPASTAAHAYFQLVNANGIGLRTKNASSGTATADSGKSLQNVYKKFVISFAGGKDDIKFYVDGDRVGASTRFSMADYSAGLQPFVQFQKTSDTNAESAIVDYVRVTSRRW